MKPKSIGIIGGAGPLAGAFLLKRILSLSGEMYGCYRDADFPQVFLISFPFSEMLCPDMDIAKLRKELSGCLEQLRKNGASVLGIACNTLHAFLDEKDELNDLVHLPRTIGEEVSLSDTPLVFCTSTSVQFGLHKQFFPCTYPDNQTQQEVDKIIDQILRGADQSIILKKLEKLLQAQTTNTVILGCTELSLFSAHLSVLNKQIIDPLEVMANKILQKSFSKIGGNFVD
jgi:aspartate racemase